MRLARAALLLLPVVFGCGGSSPTPADAPDNGSDAPPDSPPAPLDEGGDGSRFLPCPPEGPFSTALHGVVPDVTLSDCDGAPHTVHELCEADASWIFTFSAACPTCFGVTKEVAEQRQQRFAGRSYASFVVVAEDLTGPATATFCAMIRETYGLTMPVLYDPYGKLAETLGYGTKTGPNDWSIVLGRGAELTFIEQHADQNEVEGIVEALIGP